MQYGNCKFEGSCRYSHKEADLEKVRAKQRSAQEGSDTEGANTPRGKKKKKGDCKKENRKYIKVIDK